VRDWRVVRAEGDLAQPYKTLAEIALREAREMSDYQRRSLLIKELEDFGFEVVKEEWPPPGRSAAGCHSVMSRAGLQAEAPPEAIFWRVCCTYVVRAVLEVPVLERLSGTVCAPGRTLSFSFHGAHPE